MRTLCKSNCTKPSQRRLWLQQILLDSRPNREHKKSMATLPRISQSNYRICPLSQMRKGSNRSLWISNRMHWNSQRKEAQLIYHVSSSNVNRRERNHKNQGWRDISTNLFHQERTVTGMTIWVLIATILPFKSLRKSIRSALFFSHMLLETRLLFKLPIQG